MDKLSDLDVCRAVADIEGIQYMETKYKGNANFIALVSENDFTGTPPEMIGKYDPINDDALCFKLMVKYNVEIQITQERDKVDKSRGEYAKQYYAIIKRLEVMNKDIKRAILLCIIEAHKDTGNE